MLDVYEHITEELCEKKSLAALVYLINGGRELEFKYNGNSYFMSRSKAQKYVSLWGEGKEQSFDRVEELVENAIVDGKTLYSVWNDIIIDTLF